ncbi:ABC transporter permease [Petroclostridium sp. X23]|uniref:ABC transporter permease n=1 Tax=Petroclostridium sp. X23 TaxID=3045146 RepID=UPI0024ADFCE7|nr:ABC transporter permease [Petroclostridium sp. X23]WHH58807.1 ABC transporter permease [Petroclostridium sp. X23]
MKEILNSLLEAYKLIISFDKEIYGIIILSLMVTIMSTVISAVLAVPSGILISSKEFKGKSILVRLISTFMGFPPVVAGLVVYLLLSRKGPLGRLELLFTPSAMVIAQVVIVVPIITGLTIGAVKLKVGPVQETCRGLGIGSTKTLAMLFHECRYPIISAIIAGYGRAISEVGAIMLVGGNIQYNTRVMTTAIVLETGKGNYDKALALGAILLAISFIINWMIQYIQEGI